jgi:hypothetical protein
MLHQRAVVVGIAVFAFGVVARTEEPPAITCELPSRGVDITKWAKSPDDLECSLIWTHVAPKREHDAPPVQCTLFHDGVVRVVSGAVATSSTLDRPNEAPQKSAPESMVLYRKGDRVVVQHLDGHWAALTIQDFDPETISDGTSTRTSSFSRNLIAAIGGPAMPNPRAGAARMLVYVRDPRTLLRASMEGVHSDVEPGLTSGSTAATPIGVSLPELIVRDVLGSAVKMSNGRVVLRGNSNGDVEEAQLLLRAAGNECVNETEPAYWNIRMTFKELRRATDAKIPDEVKKLLDATNEKPAK